MPFFFPNKIALAFCFGLINKMCFVMKCCSKLTNYISASCSCWIEFHNVYLFCVECISKLPGSFNNKKEFEKFIKFFDKNFILFLVSWFNIIKNRSNEYLIINIKYCISSMLNPICKFWTHKYMAIFY